MHFMNIGHTYESTARLVHAVTGEYPDAEGLDAAYRTAISQLRPMPVKGQGIDITYEDGAWAKLCTDNGIFEHIFKGAGPTDGPTREAWDTKVAEALDLIESISPDLRRMVDLMVTDLVILNSGADGGGSASHIPGVVVMSPGENWQTLDYAMCLVHEGMHLNLFVADKVYGTFTLPSTELEADDRRALSAVKIGQKRPLDKAFHAAIVTVPLMFMEDHQGKTTLVDLYTKSLADACEDLKKQRPYFTEYGQMLLDELCGFGETLDFDHVARAISSPEYAGYRPAVAA
ncbi:HEXXH motif-containing putative peptide modification protein [Streptomyces sp. LX-29]|uniref:aKG-HExxH-type peptide beta-hydroxylase n=1 Tax=Streptomyces sp. LX-29 TaxID=2900152 RepID=UPI00240E4B6D|nr:HEXXH motif-containing putative peptide modification protein [Streptomyces sp. LX-29]WFB07621.1 HEXXH motif-containing putative peptide modification protein [Streptomyces sp. LX-29]